MNKKPRNRMKTAWCIKHHRWGLFPNSVRMTRQKSWAWLALPEDRKKRYCEGYRCVRVELREVE